MRTALTSFLIVSLLAGQMGMLGALVGRHHARQEMEDRIQSVSESPDRESEVEHLRLSQAEREGPGSSFVRIEDGEFRYRGKLYDVVREEWEGSVWHVWVVHDREEEEYLDALADAVKTSVLEGSEAPVQERPVAARPLALVPSGMAPPPSPRVHSQPFPRHSIGPHTAPYIEVPHPPPWA